VKQVYTMTEKEIGRDSDGKPIVEKVEKWEESVDGSTPKVVKQHDDRNTQ